MKNFVQDCPECGNAVLVETHLAGETLQCPTCSGAFVAAIPGPARRSRTGRGHRSWIIWTFVGIVGAASILGAWLVLPEVVGGSDGDDRVASSDVPTPSSFSAEGGKAGGAVPEARVLVEEQEEALSDPAEVFRANLEAANQGDAEAQFQVSRAFETGEGVEEDHLLSQHWLTQAGVNGHPTALTKIKLQPPPFPEDTSVLQERVILMKQEELRRGASNGASPFSSPSPSTYVPPQFREAQRRADSATR